MIESGEYSLSITDVRPQQIAEINETAKKILIHK